jgi:PAS domain S-box-containing protein
MSSTQMPFDEVRHLRRSLREIVALSTLPAVWTGDEPRTIGEGLAEVLHSMLRLEFVYVCIRLASDAGPVTVLRADHTLDMAHWTCEVGRALAPWLQKTGVTLPSSIPNPLGSGMVQMTAVPLGSTGQYGVVVAASRQEDFPTELDRLLLSVGANQAATALQGARLLTALRQADRLKDDVLAREQAARAEAEAARTQVMTILERVTDAFIAFDRAWRLTYVNRAAGQVLQKLYKTPEALIGTNVWEEFPELIGSTFEQEWQRAVDEQATVEFEAFYPPLNAWLEVHAYPSTDGLSVYFQDVTLRKQAEARQRLLAEASAALAASLDYETTLTTIARLVIPSLADWCVIDIRDGDGTIQRVAAAHADPLKEPLLREMQRRYPLDPHQSHAILAVLHMGRAKLYPELSATQVAAAVRDAEQIAMFQELGLESVMIVPLVAGGQTLGAMSLISADAGRRYTAADLALAEDLAGRCALAVENARLYREAQEATRAKEESLALLNTILASAPVGLGFLDRELRYVRLNPALAAINGRPLEAHLGRTPLEVNPQLPPVVESLRRYALETGKPVVNAEVSGETHAAPGQVRHWLVSYYPVRTPTGHLFGLGIIVVDITERKQAEEQLQASLKEKEVLLQEIHHRVKNNMQVISSLLNLQAGYSQDPVTLALIEDSQRRIQSMALVHESLYRSHDLGHINFAHYLRTLAEELWRAYRVDETHVRLHLDTEDVYLDIDKATPCGLLLNELVANCLKHAFPQGRAGDVHIGLHTTPERWVRLVVQDTGCGFPQGLDFRHTESLGLQLVTSLADQLQGTITLDQQEGTIFTVTFPV